MSNITKSVNKTKSAQSAQTVHVPAIFYTQPAAQITVNPESFRAWREAQATANAAKAEAETLRTLAGIPDTKGLALMLGLKLSPNANATAVFVDKDGNPVGTLTVFYMPEKQIPACFSSRIT